MKTYVIQSLVVKNEKDGKYHETRVRHAFKEKDALLVVLDEIQKKFTAHGAELQRQCESMVLGFAHFINNEKLGIIEKLIEEQKSDPDEKDPLFDGDTIKAIEWVKKELKKKRGVWVVQIPDTHPIVLERNKNETK